MFLEMQDSNNKLSLHLVVELQKARLVGLGSNETMINRGLSPILE